MALVRVVLTPHSELARGRSARTIAVSESAFQEQAWFDSAFGLLARTFSKQIFGQLANVLVALLTPAAMLALVMGLWRVAVDLGWASAFPVAGGFFSHWQVWFAVSAGLKTLSSALIAWAPGRVTLSEEN